MDSTAPSSATDATSGEAGASAPTPAGCQYEHFGDASVVTLHPELNDVKWDAIESIGNTIEGRLETQKPQRVVFDLTPLNYVGSAMVALVARWWKRINADGGECAVAVDDDNVLEVLKLAKLDTHWDIVPSREAAYKKLGISGTASRRTSRDEGGGLDIGPAWPRTVAAVGVMLGILALVLDATDALKDHAANILLVVGGAMAAIGGLVGVLKTLGTRRIVNGVLLLVGLGLLGYGLMRMFGAPDIEVPDVDAPDIEAPDIDAPELGMPDAEGLERDIEATADGVSAAVDEATGRAAAEARAGAAEAAAGVDAGLETAETEADAALKQADAALEEAERVLQEVEREAEGD